MRVRCEWGSHRLRDTGWRPDAVVIIDVLSFSTTVDIAVSRDAMVYPYSGAPEGLNAAAAALGAEAGGRRGEARYSLSPASFLDADAGARVVIHSINGARLSEEARAPVVIAGCLRNARAVAELLHRMSSVLLIAAGEQWPDGSLRPGIEDWLGAGAIACHLQGEMSAEAWLAARSFEASGSDLDRLLHTCASGRELIDAGFSLDVELASELDASRAVPVLEKGRYARADHPSPKEEDR